MNVRAKRVGLLALVVIVSAGCGSSAPKPPVTVPETLPVTTTSVVETIPPTTTVPYIPPSVLVNPKKEVYLEPGVTAEDQQAAEAAAIAWWVEVDRQLDNLPNYDRDALLALAYPNKEAGPKVLQAFDEIKGRGVHSVQGTISQVRVNIVSFQNPAEVQMEVCTANNGALVDRLGNPENTDLVARFNTTILKRYAGRWLVVNYGNNRPKEVGKSCEDASQPSSL